MGSAFTATLSDGDPATFELVAQFSGTGPSSKPVSVSTSAPSAANSTRRMPDQISAPRHMAQGCALTTRDGSWLISERFQLPAGTARATG